MKIIGHRGAAGLARENTRAAFAAAIACQVDMIELDVRLTSDGVIVVHHDPDIAGAEICRTPYAQLMAHDPELLTLAEALTACQDTPVIIEIKPRVDPLPIIEFLRELPVDRRGRLFVTSFDGRILARCARDLPDIARIVLERWSTLRMRYNCRRAHTRMVDFRAGSLWSGYIRALTRSGIELYSYVVDDPARATRWQRAGLVGIITDRPDRFTNIDGHAKAIKR